MKKTSSVLIKIILPILMCSFLTGFAYYKVTIKTDANGPLVDLSTIIKWGVDSPDSLVFTDKSDQTPSSESSTEESKEETTADDPDPKPDPKPEPKPSVIPPELTDIDIAVVGEKIIYNNTGHSLRALEESIESWDEKKVKMHFDYEYADYKTILDIERILEGIDANNYTEKWPE